MLLSRFCLHQACQTKRWRVAVITPAIVSSSQVWQAVYSFCFLSAGRRERRGICFHKLISLKSWGMWQNVFARRSQQKDLSVLWIAVWSVTFYLSLSPCSFHPHVLLLIALIYLFWGGTSFHVSRCCRHFCTQCIPPAWLHLLKQMHASLIPYWTWHVKAAVFLLLLCT